MKNWLAAGALALGMGMTATGAFAQTTTVPGEQVGLATGAPLPEGIYALNTFTYRRTDPANSPDTAVNIPVLVWATPFVPFGGRVELLVAPPTVFAFTRNPAGVANRDISINVGTFVGGIWAFDLGNNFGISLLGGVYLNDLNGDRGSLGIGLAGTPVLPQLSSNTYRAGVAASYTGEGYNLTANLTGNFYDSSGRFGGRVGGAIGPLVISDSLNLDLTATKKFDLFNQGKPRFEFGAVGYGTVNVGDAAAIVGRGGRFALGGLIGYDFGPFTAQIYVARDVVTSVAGTESTDGWFRIIAPLYSPTPAAPAPAPLVRKY